MVQAEVKSPHYMEELASILGESDGGVEKRQCVTKAVAAGVCWRSRARRPTMEEVEVEAQRIRMEQARQALEAVAVMGEAKARLAPIEAAIRTYAHDILKVNHDKDFRSHAVFPVQDLEDCCLVVIRADYQGDMVVETVMGTMCWVLWTLIWKGHMVLLARASPQP